ncbi:MAG: ABC transporter ATP-binding protein [Mycoplasma sp.]
MKNLHQLAKSILKEQSKLKAVLKTLIPLSLIKADYYSQLEDIKNLKKEKLKKRSEIKSLKQKQFKIFQNKKNELSSLVKAVKEQYKKSKGNKQVDQNYQEFIDFVYHVGSKQAKHFNFDINEYNNLKQKPVLFVKNLTKYYSRRKVPTIDMLNFNVFPGEFHAFIGANGAGKTTTIKSLITSYYKWSGTILINGIKNTEEKAKKAIGYIPEKASFPDGMSTYEYLKWMIMLSGIDKTKAKQLVEAKLRETGMWNMRHRSPNSFSSGQKKKVLLMQTLIHNPDIIIMDEPVANLDPKARIDFFDQLLELKKQNKAIFISSHVLAELDMYADSLTILDGGKIVYSGKKTTLLRQYDPHQHVLEIGNESLKQLETYLKKNKIKFIINTKSNNKVDLLLKNLDDKQIKKLQTFLTSKKIYFHSFTKVEASLEDIYRKLIVYGSKDTMKENIASNRLEGMTSKTHNRKIY